MEGFMSDIVIVLCGEEFMFVAWSRRRNAMSPVPPAISSIVQPEEGEEEEEEEPGLMLRTKWSLLEVSVARRQGNRMIELGLGKIY
jgi:hypothetical protein